MGIFDKYRKYKENRLEKAIKRNQTAIKNTKAIKEDRMQAIAFFSELENMEVSVNSLLDRFDYSLEHGIQDTREKEAAMKAIENWGEAILPHLKKRLISTSRIAWPIKLLKKIYNEEEVILALKSALNFERIDFNQADIDKNYDILCYLSEYKLPNYHEKIAYFLNEHDERLRFAAVEVLVAQDEEDITKILEPFIMDESPENIRLRQLVLEWFAKHNWQIKNKELITSKQLTTKYYVDKNFNIKES